MDHWDDTRVRLEVIACSVEDARNAAAGGADRLEVTRDLEADGLTPKAAIVERVRDAVSIPLHVMIRPRNAHSGYSAREIDLMRQDIHRFARMGVDGIVVGFLTNDQEIDFETMDALMSETQRLSVTFHRAFDHVADCRRALRELIDYRVVHRVLTSGGAPSALAGKDVLADLGRLAKDHIGVIAGGGVCAQNLGLLVRDTGLREFHIGRDAREPPAHGGTVNATKVRNLVDIARAIGEGRGDKKGVGL